MRGQERTVELPTVRRPTCKSTRRHTNRGHSPARRGAEHAPRRGAHRAPRRRHGRGHGRRRRAPWPKDRRPAGHTLAMANRRRRRARHAPTNEGDTPIAPKDQSPCAVGKRPNPNPRPHVNNAPVGQGLNLLRPPRGATGRAIAAAGRVRAATGRARATIGRARATSGHGHRGTRPAQHLRLKLQGPRVPITCERKNPLLITLITPFPRREPPRRVNDISRNNLAQAPRRCHDPCPGGPRNPQLLHRPPNATRHQPQHPLPRLLPIPALRIEYQRLGAHVERLLSPNHCTAHRPAQGGTRVSPRCLLQREHLPRRHVSQLATPDRMPA